MPNLCQTIFQPLAEPLEVVAPYSLAICQTRLLDAQHVPTGFQQLTSSYRLEFTFTRLSTTQIMVCGMRRNGKAFTYVQGELRQLDEHSTAFNGIVGAPLATFIALALVALFTLFIWIIYGSSIAGSAPYIALAVIGVNLFMVGITIVSVRTRAQYLAQLIQQILNAT